MSTEAIGAASVSSGGGLATVVARIGEDQPRAPTAVAGQPDPVPVAARTFGEAASALEGGA